MPPMTDVNGNNGGRTIGYALACMAGLRKGELFALHWDCVNLDEGILFVRRSLVKLGGGMTVKEPKTAAGRRMVTLGSQAIEALKNRKPSAKDSIRSKFRLCFPIQMAVICVDRTSIVSSGVRFVSQQVSPAA